MATQPRNHYDWPAGTANGMNVGADLITYPFLNYPNKDTNTKVYTVSRMVQKVANYVPQAALATYASNPNAYLVDESDMTIDALQQGKYIIKYAMIPSNQSQGISRSITRPGPRNTQPQAGTGETPPLLIEAADASNPILQNVAADGAIIGNCMVSATISNLYSPVYPISRWDGQIAFVSNTTPFTNTPLCLYIDFFTNVAIGAYPRLITLGANYATVVNSTAINFSPVVSSGSNVMAQAPDWSVAPFLKKYAPGTPTIRTNQTESFYLPTVSPGVNSFTDIPLPNIIANDVDYFSAIANATPNLAAHTTIYDYDGPIVWMGPIYKVTQWQVNVADL